MHCAHCLSIYRSFVFIFAFAHLIIGDDWSHAKLGIVPRMPENCTYAQLATSGAFDFHDNSCLSETDKALHSVNRVYGAGGQQTMLRGSTYWINEFMAVGHAMFEMQLLQILFTKMDPNHDIRRIILQRAPCATSDLCAGKGTWESFYKGMYTIMMEATNRNIPIFLRFKSSEGEWTAHYLGSDSNDTMSHPKEGNIRVQHSMCFQHLIRRHCTNCFYKAISPYATRALRHAAYKHVANFIVPEHIAPALRLPKFPPGPLPYQLHTPPPMVITVAHRSGHTRRMANHTALFHVVRDAFPAAHVVAFDTDHVNNTYETFIHVMHRSQIVVGTHGAFESNIIYMREGSLYVEIRGIEGAAFADAGPDYFNLAKDFLVHHRHVNVEDLKERSQLSYLLTTGDMRNITDIIADYISNAKFNLTHVDFESVLI